MVETNDEWEFAGMVTLASDTEGLLNFIPAEKIVYYLDKLTSGTPLAQNLNQ